MSLRLVLAVVILCLGVTFAQDCFSVVRSQKLQLPSWAYLRIKSRFDGVLEIRNGSDLFPAQLEIFAYSDSEQAADEVFMNLATNSNGSALVITVEDVFREPPVPSESDLSPEEYEEGSSGFSLRPSSILPLGLSAGLMASNHPRLATLPLGAYILQSAYGQQNNCSVYVNMTLTIPNAFAVDLGSLPQFEYASSGEVDWSIGNEDFVDCTEPGTSPGLCPSSNVKCTVNGVTGECIDYRSCSSNDGKRSYRGYCPGPSHIRCCVSESCRTSSGLSGVCQDTTLCSRNYGTSHSGLCPGPSNIRCCTRSTCTYQGSTGVCQPTSSSCAGTYRAGLCPGPSYIQCCARGGGSTTPNPTGSGYSFPQPRRKEGVAFAPMSGIYWPLGQSSPNSRAPVCYDDTSSVTRQSPSSPVATNFGCSARKFFASRSGGRYHSGIDLYAPLNTRVVATEPGRIVNSYFFYESVCCVIQQTDSGVVINYGEISCNNRPRIGTRVNAGDTIGYVGNLNCCHPMLHFETYRQGTTANQRSYVGNVNSRVLDPTEYLLNLRENGRQIFLPSYASLEVMNGIFFQRI